MNRVDANRRPLSNSRRGVAIAELKRVCGRWAGMLERPETGGGNAWVKTPGVLVIDSSQTSKENGVIKSDKRKQGMSHDTRRGEGIDLC